MFALLLYLAHSDHPIVKIGDMLTNSPAIEAREGTTYRPVVLCHSLEAFNDGPLMALFDNASR